MMKVVILVCCAIIATNALPAGKEDRENEIEQLVHRTDDRIPTSTISVVNSDIVEGANITPTYGYVNGSVGIEAKPPGNMLARLIDDIFQIPITVLQSVAKLLTNPFKSVAGKQASPEDSQKY